MNLAQFTSDGKFLMLALDHRQSIRKMLNPQNPDAVPAETIIKLKSEIIDALRDQISGLLIDQEFGLPAYKEWTKPFLLPLEKTGYIDQNGERITELEYTVSQVKEMGASGAKLLVYFNPNVPSSKLQLETARKVIADCKTHDFPLFLEIVTYPTPGVSSQFHPRGVKESLILDSVDMFVDNGVVPDVFKLEYPGDALSCSEITRMLGQTPWILLTGGNALDVFKEHLSVAMKVGAKGFLAGRALWQELPTLIGAAREEFLTKTLPTRFRTISEIAKGLQPGTT